jgi:protein dithiol oxidoreductase (disulfide-forming)
MRSAVLNTNNRRQFLNSMIACGWASLLLSPSLSFAQSQSQKENDPPKPYTELPKKIAGDLRTVKVFFQYTCPFCANYFSGIDGWGKTLPPSWKFEWVPVVASTSKEEFIAAMAYYAALQTDPQKISLFSLYAYDAIISQRKLVSDPNTWIGVCRSCQMQEQVFINAFKKVAPNVIQAAAKDCARYRISETPSVAIGGAYVITPSNTNGNAELFYQLLNGMVSKAMT